MKQRQFLDDMGQVFAAFLGTAASARGQAGNQAKQRLHILLQRLQLVSRDEFDALHAMLQQARMTQETLQKRLDALERKSLHSVGATSVKSRVKRKLKNETILSKKSSRSRIKRKAR